MVTTKNTELRTIGGMENVEVDLDSEKASPAGIRTFFGPPAVSSRDLMALKKDEEGKLDQSGKSGYDQIARGLFNGSLTY